jgi:hypothetical protein
MKNKKPYGNVHYADPGYQEDKKKRYPLDTEAHVRASASYFGMAKNRSKYSSEEKKKIDAAIAAAEKKFGIGKEMANVQAKDFVIFTAGTHNGETFTEADLDVMAKSFSAENPPHVFLGHSSDYKGKTMIPSWGTVKGGLKRIGRELIAVGTEFHEQMAEWIKEGFFDQRSIELTPDNKRVIAIGMLGKTPPAVAGLPIMQEVLKEGALAFSDFSNSKVLEFAEAGAIDWEEIEDKAIEETLAEIELEFEECVKLLTEELVQEEDDKDDNPEELSEMRSNCFNAIYACYDSVTNKVRVHFDFQDKVNDMEEKDEDMLSEMAEKIKSLSVYYLSKGTKFFNKRKEPTVDQKKEQEYQTKIAELEKQNKEFAEKTAKEAEAKTKAEADAKVLVLTTEVKTFCETAVKENRMTPAMRQTDEKIMLDLAKVSTEALKSFQEKYTNPVVPLGTVTAIDVQSNGDSRPQIIKNAEKYAKEHPKEFAGLAPDQAINRAFYLHSIKEINLVDTQTNQGVK